MVDILSLDDKGGRSNVVIDMNHLPYEHPSEMERDQKFVKLVDGSQTEKVDISIFMHYPEKLKALEEIFGYETLKGEKGEPTPIRQCDKNTIGSAFKSAYNAAKNRLAKQKEIDELSKRIPALPKKVEGFNYMVKRCPF